MDMAELSILTLKILFFWLSINHFYLMYRRSLVRLKHSKAGNFIYICKFMVLFVNIGFAIFFFLQVLSEHMVLNTIQEWSWFWKIESIFEDQAWVVLFEFANYLFICRWPDLPPTQNWCFCLCLTSPWQQVIQPFICSHSQVNIVLFTCMYKLKIWLKNCKVKGIFVDRISFLAIRIVHKMMIVWRCFLQHVHVREWKAPSVNDYATYLSCFVDFITF